jgi:hypothetical protein
VAAKGGASTDKDVRPQGGIGAKMRMAVGVIPPQGGQVAVRVVPPWGNTHQEKKR